MSEPGTGTEGDGGKGTPPSGGDPGAGGDPPTGGDPNAWFYADGVAGEGERPEYLLEKYSTVSDQAKGYNELYGEYQRRGEQLKGHAGAPPTFEFAMPQGVEGEFNAEHPMYQAVQEWGAEYGITQEAFTGLLSRFVTIDATMTTEGKTATLAALDEKYGPQRAAKQEELGDFVASFFGAELAERARELTQTVNGTELLEHIRKTVTAAPFNPMPGGAPAAGAATQDELNHKYLDNPVYLESSERGQALRDEYQAALRRWNAAHPGS